MKIQSRKGVMNPTVAVIAQGAMGSAVGRRLVERGIAVTTSLAGRSAASAMRARAADMIAVSDEEVARADFFLSIVPPAEALALAEKMAQLIARSNRKPIYIDCNAVNPPTKNEIARVIAKAGCPFVDVGIIGAPPQQGYDGPAFYASGPDAPRLAPLGGFGLDVRVIAGPIGAASALKMSYAGITKGLTALSSAMLLAATRAGAAEALQQELARSQPALLAWFKRAVPNMFPKAYRFVGEMEEIADFVGEDAAARQMFEAYAALYARLAADFAGQRDETNALAAFLERKS
jgi:3-hydroxyisobutyrate dehydrogenase-like beta-hydroxyacid dehydrogenase